jgi:hypothetical protein
MRRGKERKRPPPAFPVPAEVESLRQELLSAFQAGQFGRWAETSQQLKRTLRLRRREMLTVARLRDIELNVGVWKEAAE